MIVDHDHFVWAACIALYPLQKELIVPQLIMHGDNNTQHDVTLG
jgi:hypothetical protein